VVGASVSNVERLRDVGSLVCETLEPRYGSGRADAGLRRNSRAGGIVPLPTVAELREFAEFAGLSASQRRLDDVGDGLAVVTRMLVGEGVGVQVRDTRRGMLAVGVMIHVLISRSEQRRFTHWSGRTRSLADRLERVLSRRARQRLMSWYWATVLTPPPLAKFTPLAASELEAWMSGSSAAPEVVRMAQRFLASDEFRVQVSRRASDLTSSRGRRF
jgi:hypothetical protein